MTPPAACPSLHMRKSTIRLLHTSDLHGQLLSFDYHSEMPAPDRGLSRAATLIRSARSNTGLSLLLDSGDFLHGNPMTDSVPTAARHPVVRVMNRLGYDAATLGNHDFDFGLKQLASALSGAEFPVVSANLALPPEARIKLHKHVILERTLVPGAPPLKIGITGCLPQSTLQGIAGAQGVVAAPVGASVAAEVENMRKNGADLIILLAHCGLHCHEGITHELAPLHGIDAILGGHTHELYSGRTPANAQVLISGARATHLGYADRDLSLDNSERWQPSSHWHAGHCSSETADEAREIRRTLAAEHKRTVAELSRQVGHTQNDLCSYFALLRDNAGLQLVAEAFHEATQSTLDAANAPMLSLAHPKRIGQRAGARHYTRIPAGPITRRDLDSLYSFPDTLCVLDVSGDEIRLILEQSAAVFRHIPVGAKDAPLFEGALPGYRFGVIPRLEYEIDLSQPSLLEDPKGRGRIRNLTYEGKPLSPTCRFHLATSSHAARGAWPTLPSAPQIVCDTGRACRDVLAHHVARLGSVAGLARPSWRFTALPATSAVFETASTARAGGAIERMEDMANGFTRMRLRLDVSTG